MAETQKVERLWRVFTAAMLSGLTVIVGILAEDIFSATTGSDPWVLPLAGFALAPVAGFFGYRRAGEIDKWLMEKV